MLRLVALALLVACNAGCPKLDGLVCTTASKVVVVEQKPAKAPPCSTIERWVQEVAGRFGAASCPELVETSAEDVLRMLSYSHGQGLACRVTFQPAKSWHRKSDGKELHALTNGRFIDVANCGDACRETGFKHELTHSVLDALTTARWNEAQHHEIFRRCKLL